jgi:iron complex outermembrane receptor protein
MNVKRTPIASAVAIALAGVGAMLPAYAQQAAPAAPAAAASAAAQQQLEAVTVTGIRASREKSLEQKRNADSLVEVVTAEDIGKMPDKNVADAIQRVPGVNIASSAGGEGGFSENDRVSIRGTSPSLTQTLINGHAVSTGDWFVLNLFGTTVGRSASYSLLPSELVGKVTVHKSQTADLPEGGVAGAVNIETRHPLDFKKGLSGEISLGAMHSSLADKTDPQLSGLLGFRNDAKTFGVLIQLFDQKQHLRRDGSEVLGYYAIDGSVFAPGATTVVNGAAKPTASLSGVLAPSLIGASLFEQTRHRKGGALEVQFKPADNVTLGASFFQSDVDDTNMNTNFMASPKWLLQAGIAPTSATLSADGKTLLGAAFPETGAANSIINDSGIRPGAKQSSNYFNLDGKWLVNDALTVTGQVGKTRGVGESQEFASEVGNVGGAGNTPLALTYMMNGVGRAPNVGFTSSTGADFRSYANQYWNWNFGALVKVPDDEKYGSLDFDWAVDKGVLESIKFGARVTDHSRDNGNWLSSGPNWANPNVGTTLPVWNGGTYPSNFGSAFGAPFTGQFRLDPAALAQWATISTVANPNPNATFNYDPVQRHEWANDFDVREKTYAGYVMGNFAGTNWRANAGVRIVQTKGHYSTLRSPNSTDPASSIDNTSLFGPFVKEFTDRSYVDVLPSANLKYSLAKDFALRFAVAKTMARPDYTALSSTTSLNDQLNTGSSGNPNLDPVRSTNFDVAAEWYFAPRSLLSFGVFHQHFTSFVDYQVAPSVHFSDLHQRMETYNITQPINVGAKNTGFEVGYQQPIFGNFGINANYTYADGKVDGGGEMSGNSRNTYNAEAFYEGDKLSARLAYSYRSSFYGSYDRGVKMHMDGVGTLAASINYRINDTFSVSLEGLNLNNPTLKYYGDNREQPRAFYSNGRQYYLTLRAKV